MAWWCCRCWCRPAPLRDNPPHLDASMAFVGRLGITWVVHTCQLAEGSVIAGFGASLTAHNNSQAHACPPSKHLACCLPPAKAPTLRQARTAALSPHSTPNAAACRCLIFFWPGRRRRRRRRQLLLRCRLPVVRTLTLSTARHPGPGLPRKGGRGAVPKRLGRGTVVDVVAVLFLAATAAVSPSPLAPPVHRRQPWQGAEEGSTTTCPLR